MKVYSYSEARQHFAEVLRQAKREGQARIRRRDGEVFVVQPVESTGSPLDVPGVEADLTAREVVDLVRTSRRSTERLLRSRTAVKRSRPAAPARRRHHG